MTFAGYLANMASTLVAPTVVNIPAILAALGLPAYVPPPAALTLSVSGMGPISGANVSYLNIFNLTSQNLISAAPDGVVTIPQASAGLYQVGREHITVSECSTCGNKW
jgi:hypothetical protein